MNEYRTGRIAGVVYEWETGEVEIAWFDEPGAKLAQFIFTLSAKGIRERQVSADVGLPVKVTKSELLAAVAADESVAPDDRGADDGGSGGRGERKTDDPE